jgi:hypothetical protein
MLHLKSCYSCSEFGSSGILQYTLLPKLNICTDLTFLNNCGLGKEALTCLTALAKVIHANQLTITSSFVVFALMFGGYHCL